MANLRALTQQSPWLVMQVLAVSNEGIEELLEETSSLCPTDTDASTHVSSGIGGA